MKASRPTPVNFEDPQYWGGLQPDRLAEYHIGRVMVTPIGLLERLLTGRTDQQATHALMVLARAAVHQPHVGIQLRELLKKERTRLEPIAVSIAIKADSASLKSTQGTEEIYAQVNIDQRNIIWNRWLTSPGELL